MNIRLFLAMNDEQGQNTKKVRRIEAFVNPPKNGILYEPLYTLEPTFTEDDNGVCFCDIWNGAMRLKLSRKTFPIKDCHEWAGNMLTNSVVVSNEVHSEIFEYLKSMIVKVKEPLSGGYKMMKKWQVIDCLDEWQMQWDADLTNIGAYLDQGT